MKEKYKSGLFLILQVLWILVKGLITVIFVLFFIYDGIVVHLFLPAFPGNEGERWSYIVSAAYLIILSVVAAYLIYWIIFGLKRVHYIILGFCLIILYFLINTAPLQQARLRGVCLDKGYVWDKDLQKCRDDCLTWNEKEGCVPLTVPKWKKQPLKEPN